MITSSVKLYSSSLLSIQQPHVPQAKMGKTFPTLNLQKSHHQLALWGYLSNLNTSYSENPKRETYTLALWPPNSHTKHQTKQYIYMYNQINRNQKGLPISLSSSSLLGKTTLLTHSGFHPPNLVPISSSYSESVVTAEESYVICFFFRFSAVSKFP